jgi:hypothetical protein
MATGRLSQKMIESLCNLAKAGGAVHYDLTSFKGAGVLAHSIYALESRGLVTKEVRDIQWREWAQKELGRTYYVLTDAGRERLARESAE